MKKIIWILSFITLISSQTKMNGQNQSVNEPAPHNALVTKSMSAAFTTNMGSPTRTERYVTFDAIVSEGAKKYHWDFGDGTTGEGVIIAHSYKKNGSYAAVLTIEGVNGKTLTKKEVVDVTDIGKLKEPLFAAFNKNIGSPTPVNRYATFDAVISTGATSYHWEFGDGSTGEGVIIAHPYTKNGAYDVKLTVVGPAGTQTVEETIIISGIQPEGGAGDSHPDIYPNPANDIINVQFTKGVKGNVDVQLMNIQGQVVTGQQLTVDSEGLILLDVSGLTKGMYTLRMTAESEIVNERIVIE